MANGHYVIPKLVEDTSLKRARVVDGNGDSYIRVTGTVTSSDLDPIKEALGEPTDTSSDNTVIGLLKKIDVKQFGVGKAYEGSTGGEIFNYYGTDSKKNVASGDYSTAMGYNNEANGNYGFVAGSDNYIAPGNTNCVALGGNNSCVTSKAITLGNHLTSTATNQTLVGTYNKVSTALSSPKFIVGVGSSNTDPVNAIECNKATTKIRNNLQLATNSYEVNDITAPLSSPASAEDKTLTSEAWVRRRVRLYTDYVVLLPSDYVDLTLGVDEVALFQLTSPDVDQTVMLILNGSQSHTYFPYGHQFDWSSGRLTNESSYEFDIVDGLIFKI